MISPVRDEFPDAPQDAGLSLADSGVGMWFCQLNDKHRTCCEEWFKMSGLSPSVNMQCPDEVWLQSVHPDDCARVNQLMNALRSGKITQLNAQYRVLDSEGQWQRALTRGQPTRWSEKSTPTHFSGVDIFLSNTSNDLHTTPSTNPEPDEAPPRDAAFDRLKQDSICRAGMYGSGRMAYRQRERYSVCRYHVANHERAFAFF